jgi:hypothetical protein
LVVGRGRRHLKILRKVCVQQDNARVNLRQRFRIWPRSADDRTQGSRRQTPVTGGKSVESEPNPRRATSSTGKSSLGTALPSNPAGPTRTPNLSVPPTTGSGRRMSARRRTAACTSPTGTTPASAAMAWGTGRAGGFIG